MPLWVAHQRSKESVAKAHARLQSSLSAYKTRPRGMAALPLNLQSTHGNHFVQRLLKGAAIQRKCQDHSDEKFYQTAANYCRDTGFTGALHPEQRCYREVPRRSSYWQCPSGDQVCFDERGNCHDSYDRVSPVESKNADGACNLHFVCSLGHGVADVVPSMLEEMGQRQLECIKSCEGLPWYSKGFCLQGCSGTPMPF
jgi:hypothetical protein